MFTYDANMALQRDRVRLLYGDTDPATPLLQDGELALVLTGGAMAQTSDLGSALAAARIVLAKYAHTSVDISAGGTDVKLSQRVEHLNDVVIPMLTETTATTASASSVPYAGGISVDDVTERESDADRVVPYFSRSDDETPVPNRWGWR